jgi:excisionase family DNA binding protein
MSRKLRVLAPPENCEAPNARRSKTIELPSALYRIDEAAVILNVKPKTLRNKISLGQIGFYKVGRGIRISKETIQEILERSYVPAR